MNLTSKQRAYLGSEASTMNAIFQIGKASLTPELINGLGIGKTRAHQDFCIKKLCR